MAHYQLDDPNLQTALDELAARDTADWPAPSTDDKAKLARILADQPRPGTRPAAPQPTRRAA